MAEAPAIEPDTIDDAASRGALTIADRVVEKIARAAALGVDGVAPAGAGTGPVSGVLGRDLPRAEVEVAGHRARCDVTVASVWPHPAALVAAGVRDAVADQLRVLAGIEADSVSVTVDQVVRREALGPLRTPRRVQ